MKVIDGLMLREVAGNWVVIPTGSQVIEMGGIISLSESGAFLWKLLKEEKSKEELVKAFLEEYDVSEATARKDVEEFIEELSHKKLVI